MICSLARRTSYSYRNQIASSSYIAAMQTFEFLARKHLGAIALRHLLKGGDWRDTRASRRPPPAGRCIAAGVKGGINREISQASLPARAGYTNLGGFAVS
jgi:hypothetical protein